ncbi:MAG: response regulator [Bacteroidetes bacterium]|nr:MAG: response regulator [Bacteroidota bacterium]
MAKQYNILIADDEDALRNVLASELGDDVLNVSAASDGEEAIAYLKKQKFHLALLDMKMPKHTGIEVLHYIHEQHLNIKVYMLTSMDDLTTALEAKKLGAEGYLLKPYNIDDVKDRVKEALGL